MKISLVPGDYLIDENGLHICDSEGFAVEVPSLREIVLSSDIVFANVKKHILERRAKCNINVFSKEGKCWVIVKKKKYKKGEFLVKVDKTVVVAGIELFDVDDGLFLSENICGETAQDFEYEVELQNKKVEKKIIYTKSKPKTMKVIKIEQKEKIEYNDQLNRYEKRTIQETTETNQQVMETVPLYDDSGNVIGTYDVPQMESVVEEEIERDDYGQPIYEDVLDENGQVVKENKIPTKFFCELESGSIVEITKEEYDETNNSHLKALHIDCRIK